MPNTNQGANQGADYGSDQPLQGYAYMLGATTLFATVPYYLQFLSPLSGNLLFSYRVMAQLLFGDNCRLGVPEPPPNA